MKHIQATLTFHPDRVNRFRKGQLGVWMIRFTREVGNPLKIRVDDDMIVGFDNKTKNLIMLGRPVMRMMVARHYRSGVAVNPRRLLVEARAAYKADNDRIDMIMNRGKLEAAQPEHFIGY